MIKRALLLVALATVGLAGCDADGDGLKNREEKKLGLDPKNEDMDGDGLLDGEDPFPTEVDRDQDYLNDAEELAAGTDPDNPDTDGDGYLDGDEVLEGSDPTDKKSKIYKGGWPYYRFKDDLGNKKFDGSTLSVGDKFPRFKAVDQHGDLVDIYDFGGPDQQHKYIVIDVAAEWCPPCRALSEWLAGEGDQYGLDADYQDVRDAVNSGDLMWVTVISENASYGAPTEDTIAAWEDEFKNKHIPLLADEDQELLDALIGATGAWPSGVLLKATTMKVQALDTMIPAMLDEAQSRL